MYVGIAIVILLFMIMIHELGHYIAGKALGFKINEFAIGFGKVLFRHTSKKTGETFTLRLIPLGGFCSFDGDDGLEGKTVGRSYDDIDKPERKGIAYDQQPPWKRLIVLFAGAFFNFVCAILFATVLLMIVGYSQFVGFNSINTAVHQGQLQNGDVIHGMAVVGTDYLGDGSELEFEGFRLLNSMGAQLSRVNPETQKIVFKVEDVSGTVAFRIVPLVLIEEGRYGIGIDGMYTIKVEMGFFELLWLSLLFCLEMAWIMLEFLFMLVTGQVSLSGIGGPIATVSIMSEFIGNSFLNIFILVPMISVNLALFNLLPIPALDGARMVFVGIEWIRRKPVNPEIEARIHMVGILCLFAFVIFVDLNFLIGGGRGP